MSRKFTRHYADPQGVVIQGLAGYGNAMLVEGDGAPTNSQTGFQTGCLYANRTGGAGTALYVNTGTNTSSTWVAIA